MLTVQTFLEGFLTKWETSKHSLDPDDSGNYFKGTLVGSKYGVTGAALAKHRGVKSISKDDVAGVTLTEAAAIARTTYFDEANFDLLPWGPVVASAVDKCYLSGENAAVMCIQRAVGADDDGVIGPVTVRLVAAASADQEAFAVNFAKQRSIHEERVIAAKPVKAKYRKGWNNRTASYLPGTKWWKSWELDAPVRSVPAVIEDVLELKQDVEGVMELPPAVATTGTVIAVAKQMSRDTVNEVLAKAPATVVEQVTEATKLKLGEKSTWLGAALTVGAFLMDPTVQAAVKPVWKAVERGNFLGIGVAVIGAALMIAKSKSTPRTDAVIAAKRLTEPG